MTTIQLSLKKKHDDFISKLKEKGIKTFTYHCPLCKDPIEDRLATIGETWDSLSTCPSCEKIYVKITTHESVAGFILPA
jgi:hypothetical protein